MKDAFGDTLIEGDMIVYANRRGASQWLSRGVVLVSKENYATVQRTFPEPEKQVFLRTPRLIAKVLA